MATTKITITLGEDQVHEIRSLVAAGQAANVSGFVKHAVGVALSDAAGWREMLEVTLQQTGGPLTAKERTWADAILAPRVAHGPGKRKRKPAWAVSLSTLCRAQRAGDAVSDACSTGQHLVAP